MRFRTKLFLGAVISLISVATAVAASNYSEGMYRRAILDGDSTSPLYLLFTLHDAKTGKDRVVCTLGSGLVGGIHFERHLDFDGASHKKAKAIALSQPHRFTFYNRKALRNVAPHYSEVMLADFRNRLAKMSPSQIIRALNGYELDKVYRTGPPSRWDDQQAAFAHVLLERGILVGQADRSAELFVERTFFR